MTPIEIIAASHVAATLLVGGIHAALIIAGLRSTCRASDSRDRATAARERSADQCHAEAMRALDALVAGQREQATALREQGAALAALVARTAPADS